MKIPESLRKIMKRNHITEEDLVKMIEETKKLAEEDLEIPEN